MQIPNHPDTHLTYCLNVHPGGTPADVEQAAFNYFPKVIKRVAEVSGAKGPYGLGPWLSASAAESFIAGNQIERFRKELEARNFYVFTLNGFPYGEFHGTRVKENVYRPDWSDPARLDYTRNLARILDELLPENVEGSISTLPVAYRAYASDAAVDAAIDHLISMAVFLDRLKQRSGKTIRLALEPEPDCLLDAVDGVVEFFENKLFAQGAIKIAKSEGLSLTEAEALMRRHIGVCLDTIHCAVLFEKPLKTFNKYAAAGIEVCKVHLGAALVVPAETARESLSRYNDQVWLHQTSFKSENKITRFKDLPDYLATEGFTDGQVRVHYHVPLSWTGTENLTSSKDELTEEFLAECMKAGVKHFEVEVYTLDMFPDASGRVTDILADELLWVLNKFGGK